MWSFRISKVRCPLISKDIPQLLVVDDDPEDLLLIRTAVNRSKVPLQVNCYGGGEEFLLALDTLVEESAPVVGGGSLLIVFLDLNMPRKDGRSCLKDIRRDDRYTDIPVIVFSTSASDEDILRSYELGANSYICKPDDLESLERIIKEVYRYWFGSYH